MPNTGEEAIELAECGTVRRAEYIRSNTHPINIQGSAAGSSCCGRSDPRPTQISATASYPVRPPHYDPLPRRPPDGPGQ